MADIKYEVKESYVELSISPKGGTKELNLISWNGATAKFDIREWDPDHEKTGKGVTLTTEEAETLYELLAEALGK